MDADQNTPRSTGPGGDDPVAWHALSPEDCLERLDSRLDGLDEDEVSRRRERLGDNALPAPPPRPAWRRLAAQFNNILIHLLLVAGVAAAVLGHWVDAAVILAVVVVNALIGFLQEGKAERAMEAIGRMLAPKARVRREGQLADIVAESLVPGDIVELKAGDRIPADIRLLKAHGLQVDQAALTGESVPVDKSAEPDPEGAELADRAAVVHAGGMVTRGQATGVVVETGWRTELGRISHLLEGVESLTTPLLREIDRFGRGLSMVILAVAAGMVGLAAWLHATPLGEGFLAGVALAVAAIPEGLPAIITVTLAIGVQRMATRQAGVRRLPAVETLGAVSVICTDKTGTLTCNELQARRLAVSGDRDAVEADAVDTARAVHTRLLEAAVLCNDAPADAASGDPLERALVRLADQAGLDVEGLREDQARTALLPFSSDAKFMASRHGSRVALKGAPEAILGRCGREADAEGGARPLDAEAWQARMHALAEAGLRVLAFAECRLDGAPDHLDDDALPEDACLLGLIAFEDPPRPEVPAAIAACRSAGIEVKMITGDHAATAAAIAGQLSIGDRDAVITGPELDRLDDDGLREAAVRCAVFARTTPEHKLRLVQALQAGGAVVAMTGDGANDAPALKRADIGVAMGIKGTEASRQAAEIVLADDNFASIVSGVEEGRGVYDNIRKALMFILPTNAAQALVVLVAALIGMGLPITPVQILWINMVTAVTLALAVAFEPLEGNVMRRRPRPPGRGLVTAYLAWRVAWVGALITAGVFLTHGLATAGGASAEVARTVAMNTLVAAQLVYLFSARLWVAPGYTPAALFANPWAWLSVAVLLVLQGGLSAWPPAQRVFGTAWPEAGHWAAIGLVALAVFVLVEAEKGLLRLRRRRRRPAGGGAA
ncbi:MAG: cation-translocating P-type ATPase [Lysobacteraceae bacterium]